MTKTLLVLVGITLGALLPPHLAAAQVSTVRVTGAFAPAAPAGRTTAVYMNLQGGPDRLISVASDAAGQAELRETIVEGGAISTRGVGGVLVNPGQATRLAPGGLHILLSGLKRPLKDGDTVTLTLTFERAGKVTAPIPVARTASAATSNVAVPGLRSPGR